MKFMILYFGHYDVCMPYKKTFSTISHLTTADFNIFSKSPMLYCMDDVSSFSILQAHQKMLTHIMLMAKFLECINKPTPAGRQ